MNFGNQKVGTRSAARTVTLTNVGATALSLQGISLGGVNPGDFARTNTCQASVGPGLSCTISVTFTPTAKGSRKAVVAIQDNGGGSPQKVFVSGTGT